MKRFTLLLFLIIFLSVPAYAKQKIVGYETKYITTKVKIQKRKYIGKFKITYYCPCSRCCGVGGGIRTATGTRPKAGRTVGVNPNVIKYGTELKIGNHRGYKAEDTGGMSGRHIDIFVNSHREALRKGVDYKKVWIIKTKIKKKRVKVKVPIFEERGKK